jgi:hypothetical protein
MATQIDVDEEGNEFPLSLSSDAEADQIIELINGGITKLDQVNGEIIQGYFSNKLDKVAHTKNGIAAAIMAKGVEIPPDASFASYESLIGQIQGGPEIQGTADLYADMLLSILEVEDIGA